MLVAWDRDLFTLVKSEAVDLNDQFEGLRWVREGGERGLAVCPYRLQLRCAGLAITSFASSL